MGRSIKSVKFLSEAEILAINEEAVSRYGGLHGVRDMHLVHLAVGRPQMSVGFHDAYPSVFDKAAALFHSIINNHPFFDGNKRTSFFGAIVFLEHNGWEVEFKRKEGVKFARKVHDNDLNVPQIAEWLKAHPIKKSSKTIDKMFNL